MVIASTSYKEKMEMFAHPVKEGSRERWHSLTKVAIYKLIKKTNVTNPRAWKLNFVGFWFFCKCTYSNLWLQILNRKLTSPLPKKRVLTTTVPKR